MSQDKMFTCDNCGKRTEASPEEVARAEYEVTFFKPFDEDQVNVVCDDCYNKIIKWAESIDALPTRKSY